MLHLHDLLTPGSNEFDITRYELGYRAGMDTGIIAGRDDQSIGTISVDLSAEAYGVWGEYGFAVAALGSGDGSGSANGIPVTGQTTLAYAAVIGTPTGSNPSGLGSATWSGAAEAVALANNQRRFGTATVTMADLSRPYIDVDVIISGRSIGTSAWDDIALRSDGLFETGSVGQDFMFGGYYGAGTRGGLRWLRHRHLRGGLRRKTGRVKRDA
ncbi:MAG: hypothetical protein OXP75_20050 [Rhodospirillales bacterium]|nr:hypothetical protein [Rhodospirillales bacterium]